MSHSGLFYVLLNVLRRCDLSERSITLTLAIVKGGIDFCNQIPPPKLKPKPFKFQFVE